MTDEIMQELWRVKDEVAKQFNYDAMALGAELQRQQKESGQPVVNLEMQSAKQEDTPSP
jgi:hypothetical protein